MAAPVSQPELALRDRVVTPDGREGEVVGFYRSADESVLVSFATDDVAKYPVSAVVLFAA